MPRTALPRALTAAAVLFGLVSTGFASIALVKAPHNFPSLRAVTARSDAANQSSTVRSDHVALLIANSNYPDAAVPLPEVAAGADLLANVLRSHGFVVDVVRDATHAGITEAVGRLKAETRPGSVVLVYFGGFGVQSRGQNYMIPVDAKIWEERDVRRDGVGVEKTLSELSTSGARKRIAIVDASRRNPYERRFRGIFTRTGADRERRELDRHCFDAAGAGRRGCRHITEPFRQWPRCRNKSFIPSGRRDSCGESSRVGGRSARARAF
jgi:hypothetical protein